MEKVFNNPAELERLVKQKIGFPDFVMMENAALAIKKLIEQAPFDKRFLSLSKGREPKRCLILCGKGNNGGDGYALARLLGNTTQTFLYMLAEPTAPEAKKQYEMCRKLKFPFLTDKKLLEFLSKPCDNLFIIDCLFGTGFKGELSPQVTKILKAANNAKATRIACDIPSGLAFNADYTVTMGEHKLALFSDKAKQTAGQIIVADLGVDPELFQNQAKPAAFLVTADDMRLPLRTNKAAHKGTYGHTAVFAGEKSGAAIICATAAMNFGSGLTTLIPKEKSNLEQFKISPELMISKTLPKKASCVVLGPGIQNFLEQEFDDLAKWFNSASTIHPAVVFDAGVFDNPLFPKSLKALDSRPDARIVLTPHLLELVRLCKSLKIKPAPTVDELANDPELKIRLGQKINKMFPNTVLVIKSANTFISACGQTFIITDGCPSLAKGGSGDVLAGMIAALLSQNYSAQDAAITACQAHALAAKKIGASSYSLTPMKLINAISKL